MTWNFFCCACNATVTCIGMWRIILHPDWSHVICLSPWTMALINGFYSLMGSETEIHSLPGFELVYSGLETEFTCERLSPGTPYTAQVSCVSSGGRSEPSDPLRVTTLPVCPGQCPPPWLTGKPKAHSLHLKWGQYFNIPSFDMIVFSCKYGKGPFFSSRMILSEKLPLMLNLGVWCCQIGWIIFLEKFFDLSGFMLSVHLCVLLPRKPCYFTLTLCIPLLCLITILVCQIKQEFSFFHY